MMKMSYEGNMQIEVYFEYVTSVMDFLKQIEWSITAQGIMFNLKSKITGTFSSFSSLLTKDFTSKDELRGFIPFDTLSYYKIQKS